MKNTSIRSYKELVESGELSKKQVEVANCFRKNGSMTARQASAYVPQAWKRIKSLVDVGVLTDMGTIYDHTTKRVVHYYIWTGDQPLLVPIKDTAKKVSKYDEGYADGIADAFLEMYKYLLNAH